MDKATQVRLISFLEQLVTEHKRERMNAVLANRTRHVTVVLEDLFQEHNASAVMRSIECFGVQDLHAVEMRNRFIMSSGVAMGASKWINIHRYKTMESCYQKLKTDGYRIIATTPHATARSLPDLSLEKKFALIFGTEHVGLSGYAFEHADEFVTIPMYGFTQSFNVSVSVALSLYHITNVLRASSLNWRLSEQEMRDIKLTWLRKTIPGCKGHEATFFAQ